MLCQHSWINFTLMHDQQIAILSHGKFIELTVFPWRICRMMLRKVWSNTALGCNHQLTRLLQLLNLHVLFLWYRCSTRDEGSGDRACVDYWQFGTHPGLEPGRRSRHFTVPLRYREIVNLFTTCPTESLTCLRSLNFVPWKLCECIETDRYRQTYRQTILFIDIDKRGHDHDQSVNNLLQAEKQCTLIVFWEIHLAGDQRFYRLESRERKNWLATSTKILRTSEELLINIGKQ